MDRAYHEEIAGVLHSLLVRLGNWLPGKEITLIAEFIDANELGLALEKMADVLSEGEKPLKADERADMLAVVDRMQMGALTSTPATVAEAAADVPPPYPGRPSPASYPTPLKWRNDQSADGGNCGSRACWAAVIAV